MAKKRIIKYAGPYMSMVVIAIVLLFAQANFDLALPDYLSDIVDTGIQQQGIENAVPTGLREEKMNKLEIFMTPEEETMILEYYTLINTTSPDYTEYLEEFSGLINGSIFVLRDLSKVDQEELDPIMAELMTIVFSLEQIYANQSLAEAMGVELALDLSLFPTEEIFF